MKLLTSARKEGDTSSCFWIQPALPTQFLTHLPAAEVNQRGNMEEKREGTGANTETEISNALPSVFICWSTIAGSSHGGNNNAVY